MRKAPGDIMNKTEKIKNKPSAKNSDATGEYVYFAIAKEWKKVSKGQLQNKAIFGYRLN